MMFFPLLLPREWKGGEKRGMGEGGGEKERKERETEISM